MFVGCSEISVSVIVKHMQNTGIIRTFCLPGGRVKLSSAYGDRKHCWVVGCGCGLWVAGLWLAREGGGQFPG